MLKVKHSFMATDENGDEVFVGDGDAISEIEDDGPEVSLGLLGSVPIAWNVSFRFTPSHKLWSEVVTYDAVKLLKALEG